ncbi:MAG: hypothetical protein JW829_01010 [Pirellulales bacterium]|nr:hypothetical protein [Pirellulales bacterium]
MVDPDCVNLLERFGDRYKIAFDECYDPKHRPRESLDPWFMRIPCKIGHINPYGGEILELFVDGHRKTRAKIKKLDFVMLYTEGDDEASFLFDVKDFNRVAHIAGPLKRRRLTDEQKAKAAVRLQKYQYRSADKTRLEAQRRTQTVQYGQRY